MPVYNAEMHIKDAIESVLEQSFVDFEFILIDDGSIDRTSSIIRSYNDKRVRLIQNSHNFIESLNLGIE
ncbi:glycosyl transferase 2 family protein, partial [Bacteroides fragilis str. Ds-233]